MTRDELKARLYRYRDLDRERRQLLREIERVEAMMTAPRGPNLDGNTGHSGGPGDPVFTVVSQHLALIDRYREQVTRLAAEQTEIERSIEPLEPVLRCLLRYRYIDGLTWEEVCVKINYSWRQTHYLHARALDELLGHVNE